MLTNRNKEIARQDDYALPSMPHNQSRSCKILSRMWHAPDGLPTLWDNQSTSRKILY
ncbi:hypothetical protein KTT_11320 [Tengunoibacter tsumagoiensis]|uniref:Uncharacterized protein n=1 Tax=Tengunoibacter tsumagoiensis TaxID=2014871 RepID=A0A401ZWM6_9CHLR|nr:hypothetical protein KTT_11320 [Tengunoibacter tsumagoiensis]